MIYKVLILAVCDKTKYGNELKSKADNGDNGYGKYTSENGSMTI